MFELVKALHVTGVILWMSAMLAAPLLLHLPADPAARRGARLFFRLVSGIGITVTWILGLWLVTVSGQLSDPWMMAKLGIVLILSGAQGAFAARFRRAMMPETHAEPGLSLQVAVALTLGETALILIIAVLVLTKPF